MKIAISGKGGVGKTLLAALLSKMFVSAGFSVIAIDADPDANLAATLGFSDTDAITPISEMKELIQERTGASSGLTSYFKINPKVDDIPEKYSKHLDGVRLMRMGNIKGGGAGCYCPENALLKTLMAHLLLARDEVIILDMEAGIEHLTRGTAEAVDRLIVVVEPGRRSVETARSINRLAVELGIRHLSIVGNKVRGQQDIQFLKKLLPDYEFLGFVPYDQAIVDADLAGGGILESSSMVNKEVRLIYESLTKNN